PNRTVKRFYADDSAATSVKVGYRQASYKRKTPVSLSALKIALGASRVFFRPQIRGVFPPSIHQPYNNNWCSHASFVRHVIILSYCRHMLEPIKTRIRRTQ
ncbi:hypothetical protein, partial [Massilia frigida]|uniref:hypothetical protein n=1 Tax=Massilia frigida TaxID=2609281 RepID=UPI001CB6E15D